MSKLESIVAAILVTALASTASAQTATVTPILLNGPDADKKVIVVLGDGYTQADLPAYRQWVQDTVIDGVFAQDEFFRAHHTAFNVYRIDVVSPESGVTIRRYSSGCGTSSDGDDVEDTSCTDTSTSPCYSRDTALDYVFTDCWGRCWMEETGNTNTQAKRDPRSAGAEARLPGSGPERADR